MSIAFSYINYLEDASPIIASSENSNFPASNVITPFRSKSWRSTAITNQYVQFDLGYQAKPSSFYLVNEQRGIQISEQAVIKVIGTNDGNWTTPEVDITIQWNESLITKFSNSLSGTLGCRFYRISIDDPNNIESFIEVGNMFLGETLTFTSTDVSIGWRDKTIDDSDRTQSDGGEVWYDQKTQKAQYSIELQLMTKVEKDLLVEMFRDVGNHKPFYVSLDPEQKITSSGSELAIYSTFDGDLEIANVFKNAYNVSLVLKEVV